MMKLPVYEKGSQSLGADDQRFIDAQVAMVAQDNDEQPIVGSTLSEIDKWTDIVYDQRQAKLSESILQMLKEGQDVESSEALMTYEGESPDGFLERSASQGVVAAVDAEEGEDTDNFDITLHQELQVQKSLLLENQLLRVQQERDDRSWTEAAVEVAASVVTPLYQEETVYDLAKFMLGDKAPLNPVEGLKMLREEYALIDNSAEAEEFIRRMKDGMTQSSVLPDKFTQEYIWDAMREYTKSDEYNDTAFMFIDVAFTGAEAVGAAVTGGKLLAKSLRNVSPGDVAQALGRDKAATETATEFVSEGTGVDKGVSATQGRAFDFEDTVVPRMFTEDELSKASEQTKEILKAEIDRQVRLNSPNFAGIKWDKIDIQTTVDSERGMSQVTAYIGAGDGKTPFVTREGAEEAIEAMGMTTGRVVEANGKTGFYIAHTTDVNPMSAKTMEFDKLEGISNFGKMFKTKVASADVMVDDVFGNSFRHLSTDAQTGFRSQFIEVMKPINQWYRKNKADWGELGKVLEKGQRTFNKKTGSNGVFYSRKEFGDVFQGRDVDGAWEQYTKFKRLDEAMYRMKNTSVRNRLVADEWKEVLVNGKPHVMRESNPGTDKVFSMKTGEQIVDWKDKGLRVFRNSEDNKLYGFRDQEIGVRALPDFVLSRTEGGRMDYSEAPFFVRLSTKQGIRPTTLATAKSRKDAEEFIEGLTTSLKAIEGIGLRTITRQEADDIIQRATIKHWGFNGVKDFEEYAIKSGMMKEQDKGYKFFYPSLDIEGRSITDLDNAVEEVDMFASLYTSPRGEKLIPNVNDRNTYDLMDPWEAQIKAMETVGRRVSTDEVARRTFETFKHNAMEAGILDTRRASTMSPSEIFNNTPYISKMTAEQTKMFNRLELMKDVHSRAFMKATDFDKAWQDVVGKILRDDPDARSQRTSNLARITNPVHAMRSSMFHLNLGWYSMRQAWLQASAIMNTVAISPKAGLTASMQLPALRLVAAKPSLAPYIAKKTAHLMGMKESEFIELAEDFMKSNKYYIGGEVGELGVREGALKLKDAAPWWTPQGLWNNKTVFFNEGERLNRTVGWLAAMAERKAAGKGRPKSPADFAQLSMRGDVLTNRMTTASNTNWARGLASVPTQFMRFQYQWAEAMFSRHLTAAEKVRFGMANFLGLGAGSVVGGNLALDFAGWAQEATGSDTVSKVAYYGVLDNTLNIVRTSLDMEPHNIYFGDLGPQLATNTFVKELVNVLRGHPDATNVWEVLLGPSSSLISGMSEGTANIFRTLGYGFNQDPSVLYSELPVNIAHMMLDASKSGTDAMRVYNIIRAGQDKTYRSFYRDVVKGEETTTVLKRILGVKDKDIQLAWDLKDSDKIRKQALNDASRLLSNLAQTYSRGEGGDHKEFKSKWMGIMLQFEGEDQAYLTDRFMRFAGEGTVLEKLVEELTKHDLEGFNE